MRVEPIPAPTPAARGRRWTAADAAYLLLRVATGLLFIAHGLQKLFGLFGGIGNGGAAPLGRWRWSLRARWSSPTSSPIFPGA
jgi:hypothetical protein